MSGKRVLVTGATGFIGQQLVNTLIQQGHQVTAMVRASSDVTELKRLGVRIVSADLNDTESLKVATAGQQVIYHLASVTRAVTLSTFDQINLTGFENLLTTAIVNGDAPRVIFVSSLAAVGPSATGEPYRESVTPEPISNYGKSKLAAEQVAFRFCDRLKISIVRPPMVLGPRDTRSFQLFKLIDRFGVYLQPGFQTVEYSTIHVADLVEALIAVAEKGQVIADENSHAGIYHAAADEVLSSKMLRLRIANALGKRFAINLPIPHSVLKFAGAVNTAVGNRRGEPMFLNYDKVRDITSGSWACRNDKLKQETGFTFTTPLSERIAQTARWYRAHGWLSPESNQTSDSPSVSSNQQQSSNGQTTVN